LNLTVPSTSNFSDYIFINKHHQSMGYMIISFAVVLCGFILADKWKWLRENQLPLFGGMGQSALFYYIISGALKEVGWVIIGKEVGADLANGTMGVVQGGTGLDLFICLMIITVPILLIAWLFQKYKIRLAL